MEMLYYVGSRTHKYIDKYIPGTFLTKAAAMFIVTDYGKLEGQTTGRIDFNVYNAVHCFFKRLKVYSLYI